MKITGAVYPCGRLFEVKLVGFLVDKNSVFTFLHDTTYHLCEYHSLALNLSRVVNVIDSRRSRLGILQQKAVI